MGNSGYNFGPIVEVYSGGSGEFTTTRWTDMQVGMAATDGSESGIYTMEPTKPTIAIIDADGDLLVCDKNCNVEYSALCGYFVVEVGGDIVGIYGDETLAERVRDEIVGAVLTGKDLYRMPKCPRVF